MRYITSPLTSSPISQSQDEKLRERLKDLFAYIPATSKKAPASSEENVSMFFYFLYKRFLFLYKNKTNRQYCFIGIALAYP